MRFVLGLALVLVAMLCSLGFVAAGEPGNHWLWRVGYAVAGIVCLGAGARMLAGQHPTEHDATGDDR